MRTARLAAAFLLALLYLWGLAPSVHIHDAGELTAAAWTLGVGHPPGAPLYMLVSKAFLLLVPLGSIAWRSNLFSAAAAVASFLLFDALTRRLTGKPLLALGGAAAFALSATFWSQAEMAEVYTLQALLLLAFLWAFSRTGEADGEDGGGGALPAFLWGLLLACHMGLSPVTPLVLLVLARPARSGLAAWARGVVRLLPPFLLPLLLYAYLPLRSLTDPPLDWGNPQTPLGFWWHLTNRQVRGRMLSLPIGAYLERLGDYLAILGANLHILLPLALAGAFFGWKRRSPLAMMLLLIAAADAGFVILLDTAPLASEAYAIPSVLTLALLAVWGASSLGPTRLGRPAGLSVAAAAGLSLFVGFGPNDLHRNFLVRDAAEGILQQVPPGAALLVQEDNTTNPLAYLAAVEGARPDLEIYDRLGNLFGSLYGKPLFLVPGQDRPAFRKGKEEPAVAGWLAAGRPVSFSTPFLEYAPSEFALSPGGFASAAYPPKIRPSLSLTPPVPAPRPGFHPDWMSRQILAELATRRAEAALSREDPVEIGPALREALAQADLPELFLRTGQIARRAGEDGLALEAVRRTLAKAPGLAPALSLQGTLLLAAGDDGGAERALRAAAMADPDLPQPYALLGRAAARRGDWGTAREAFGQSLQRDPLQPDLLHDRALTCLALGDRAAAEADLRSVLKFAPGHRAAALRLARLLLEDGRPEEARDILCGACGTGPASAETPKTLKDLLILSAQAAFPPCIGGWLEDSAPLSGEPASLADAYRGAARSLAADHKGNQQR